MDMKFQRILVPIDFSENAVGVLDQAEALAKQFGAELNLVHVVESSPYEVYQQRGFLTEIPHYSRAGTTEPGKGDRFVIHDVLEESRVELERMIRKGWKAKATVRHGPVVDELLAEAKEYKADLILISTHGWTGFKHMLLGSVAERIVRLSPIPVLTVRIQPE